MRMFMVVIGVDRACKCVWGEVFNSGQSNSMLRFLQLDWSNVYMGPVIQKIAKMMKPLSYDRSRLFATDVSYYKFLNRLHEMELKMRAEGLWEVPHPWLNLFVPKSSITKFGAEAFKSLPVDTFSGPVLVYPLNKSKYELLFQSLRSFKFSHHGAVNNKLPNEEMWCLSRRRLICIKIIINMLPRAPRP